MALNLDQDQEGLIMIKYFSLLRNSIKFRINKSIKITIITIIQMIIIFNIMFNKFKIIIRLK